MFESHAPTAFFIFQLENILRCNLNSSISYGRLTDLKSLLGLLLGSFIWLWEKISRRCRPDWLTLTCSWDLEAVALFAVLRQWAMMPRFKDYKNVPRQTMTHRNSLKLHDSYPLNFFPLNGTSGHSQTNSLGLLFKAVKIRSIATRLTNYIFPSKLANFQSPATIWIILNMVHMRIFYFTRGINRHFWNRNFLKFYFKKFSVLFFFAVIWWRRLWQRYSTSLSQLRKTSKSFAFMHFIR